MGRAALAFQGSFVLLASLVLMGGRAYAKCAPGGDVTLTAADAPGQCRRLLVPETSSSCAGTKAVQGNKFMMEVRAVHYAPRPAGATWSSNADLYTIQYQAFHDRDLYLIAEVLGANAVRLDPWDSTQDHSNFLSLCAKKGLWVIPSYDLRSFFINPTWQAADFFTKRSAVQKGFYQMLTSVRGDDPILGWSVNYALPLSDTSLFSPQDADRDFYVAAITVMRDVHYYQEWNNITLQFKRPLMLPVDMNSRAENEDICRYVKNMETKWLSSSLWPSQTIIDSNATAVLAGFGAFDVWVPDLKPGTTADAAQNGVSLFKQLYTNSSAFNGTACVYNTSKAMLFEIGFPALAPPSTETQVPQPRIQQALVQYMWDHLRPEESPLAPAPSSWQRPCSAGGLVDEWMDDWNRCGSQGFADNPWSQSEGTDCDVPTNGIYAYMEWMGLSTQYSFFGMHCINPRFLNMSGINESSKVFWLFAQSAAEANATSSLAICSPYPSVQSGNLTVAGAFRFDPLTTDPAICLGRLYNDSLTLQRGPNLCSAHLPSVQVKVLYGLCVAAVIAVYLFRWLGKSKWKCRWRGGARGAAVSTAAAGETQMVEGPLGSPLIPHDHPRSEDPDIELGPDAQQPACRDTAASSSGPAAPREVPRQAFTVHITATPCDLVPSMKDLPFTIHMKCDEAGLEAHLKAHILAQERRLQYQIRSEVEAVKADHDATSDTDELRWEAIRNVHLRALEGYLVWKAEVRSRERRPNTGDVPDPETPETLDEASSYKRYTEVLLLRVLESLAEQALHSPEFISRAYHKAREDNTIDLDYLHSALRQLERNPDPYNGGINFDDINDSRKDPSAENESEPQIEKTCFEAVSFEVILDLIYNFQPVLMIKVWIFFLAVYVHLGDDVTKLSASFFGASPPLRGDLNGSFLKPNFERLYAIAVFACLEPLLACCLEILAFLRIISSNGGVCRMLSNFVNLPTKWFVLRRVLTLAIAVGCIGISALMIWPWVLQFDPTLPMTKRLDQIPSIPDPKQEKVLKFSYMVLILRAAGIWLATRPRLWIPFAECKECKVHEQPYLPGRPPTRAENLAQSQQSMNCLPGSSQDVRKHEGPESPGGIKHWAWLTMLASSFLFEVYCIVPLLTGFTPAFCTSSCRPKPTRGNNICGFKSVVSSECIACGSSLALVWILVALTAFFDLYFIFYAGTGFFGYMMGAERTLSNVLSMALRQLDFGEAAASDADNMKTVFGDSWRKVWSRIVESLFDEHLISSDTANQMVKAAKTLRWTTDTKRQQELDGEKWFFDKKDENIKNFDLQAALPVVQERLAFFMASLRGVASKTEKSEPKLLDSSLGSIPALSQIIPCYSEVVISDEKTLKDNQSDRVGKDLGFIISQYPEEWDNFAEVWSKHLREKLEKLRNPTITEEELKEAPLPELPGGASHFLYIAFMHGTPITLTPLLRMEVRLWASMRGQTVSRTVIGALLYHDVLAMVPQVGGKVKDTVELLLASQVYGEEKEAKRDQDVRYLLGKYQDKSFFLVFDFKRSNARTELVKLIDAKWKEISEKEEDFTEVSTASVLAKCRERYDFDPSNLVPPEDMLEIVLILPRKFKLLLADKPFQTQGKAGNQLGALRFARGHVLQMMDANMGAFLGEACKVPLVTRLFLPKGQKRWQPQARIIGFREFIFTERHGEVGRVMASSEWTFGTICQRFLHGIGGRMHYGHPDFLDAFWVSNRGSMSKASPAINLSEDIFAGFNVRMRGEVSMHVDTLAWEKGREASFVASSGFFTKISGGSVGVMRSRDLKIITRSLNIIETFSFFFASVGFYLNNLLIDMSATVYVWLFIALQLASKSLHDVGSLDTMLGAEWVVSIGVIAMLPRLMELVLECGPLEGMFKFIPSIPANMAMFTFINKSVSSAVFESMETGEAGYVDTGRPNANTHYTWRTCYRSFCRSHYYPAIKILLGIVVYHLLAEQQAFGRLPMIVLTCTALLWLTAPVLFCPQPTLLKIGSDLTEFWQFIAAAPKFTPSMHEKEVMACFQKLKEPKDKEKLLEDKKEKEHFNEHFKPSEKRCEAMVNGNTGSMYEFWLQFALLHKKSSVPARFLVFVVKAIFFVILWSMIPARMLDGMSTMLLLPLVNWLLMEIWRSAEKSPFVMLVSMTIWLVLPVVFFQMSLLEYVVKMLLILQGLEALRDLMLLCIWVYAAVRETWRRGFSGKAKCFPLWSRPSNLDWSVLSKEKDRTETWAHKKEDAGWVLWYDAFVISCYTNFSEHLFHLYAAFFILLMKLVVQASLALLDSFYGLHSWYLLNSRLRSKTLFAARSGYEPPAK